MQIYQITASTGNTVHIAQYERIVALYAKQLEILKKEIATFNQDEWMKATDAYKIQKYIVKAYNYKLTQTQPRNRNLSSSGKVSIAYMKLYEILSFIGIETIIKPGNDTKLSHFDNASMPGDFIRCMHDFINGRGVYDWQACSFIDTKSNTIGDRYGLMKRDPDRWIMLGKGGITGNLCDPTDVARIVKVYSGLYDVTTSDFGFEFKDRFNEDYEYACGNIGQIIIGLSLLRPGGILISKCFGISYPLNRWIIVNLAALFSKLYICKPFMSKPNNHEFYIVGIGLTAPVVEFVNVLTILHKKYGTAQFVFDPYEKIYKTQMKNRSLSYAVMFINENHLAALQSNVTKFKIKAVVDLTADASYYVNRFYPS